MNKNVVTSGFVFGLLLAFSVLSFAEETPQELAENFARSKCKIYYSKLVLAIATPEIRSSGVQDKNNPEILSDWANSLFDENGNLKESMKNKLLESFSHQKEIDKVNILPRFKEEGAVVKFMISYKDGDSRIVKFYPDGTIKRILPAVMDLLLR